MLRDRLSSIDYKLKLVIAIILIFITCILIYVGFEKFSAYINWGAVIFGLIIGFIARAFLFWGLEEM